MSNKNERNMVYTKETLRGKILTVKGIMSPDGMGITLPHEHLICRHQGPDVDMDNVDIAVQEIQHFLDEGGKTLVEQSNERIGRDPAALKIISEATGLNVIMGCGYYKEAWVLQESLKKSADEIAAEIEKDIFTGVKIGEETIHAGHIGEIGTSKNITEFEINSIRGAARAQKSTGAALSIHFDLDNLENEHEFVLKLLDDEGVDLRRVVINHVIPKIDNIDRIIRLSKRGVKITFDHFGIDIDDRMRKLIDTPTEEQLVTVKELLRRGLIDHLMLSQDLCFKACYKLNGGFGYTNLLKNIIPFLRKLHVNEYDIERLIQFNARNVFTFGGRFPSY